MGFDALYYDTGSYNAAYGYNALVNNTTGSNNTALGANALMNSAASFNTAVGYNALVSDITGGPDTAVGESALYRNTGGSFGNDHNTAVGNRALYGNTTGGYNVAIGYNAGQNLTTGNDNIDIGNVDGTSLNSSDAAGETDTIRIGYQGLQSATYIAGISNYTVTGGNPVFIDSNGRLGIGSLVVAGNQSPNNPTVAQLKARLAAQEETIAQLKSAVSKQQAVNAEQAKGMAMLAAQIKKQNAKIQRVSDRVELAKPAPATVNNSR